MPQKVDIPDITVSNAVVGEGYQQQQRQPQLQQQQQLSHHNQKLKNMQNLLPLQILKKVIEVYITTAFIIESQS